MQNQTFRNDFQWFQSIQTEVTTIIKVATIRAVLTLSSFRRKKLRKGPGADSG